MKKTYARFHPSAIPTPEFEMRGKCVSSHEYPTTNTVVTPIIVQNIICAGGAAILAKIYGAVNTACKRRQPSASLFMF
jgi:hypothetical protein